MRRLLWIAVLPIFLLSCANDGWGVYEKRIINSPSDILRVLRIDNEDDNSLLRMQSSGLSVAEIRTDTYDTLAKKMIATVQSPDQDGVGIAGPQVGILRRIVAVQRFDKPDKPFEVYPNISIIEMRGDKVTGTEGCLSVPDRKGEVQRSNDITISYISPNTYRDTTEIVKGFTAVIFQHECDHLDGILYTDRIWEDPSYWYNNCHQVNENYADVFYITSTNIMSSFDQNGKEVFTIPLSEKNKEPLSKENDYISSTLFGDSINFFAPYYHQFTMSTCYLPEDQQDSVFETVGKEVFESFRYYMNNFNNGRKYILAGFSQGAQQVKYILKHMNASEYSNMVAAYVLGFGINSKDLECARIKPAQSETDTGVCISFNTVKDTSSIWSLVQDNSCACINPVNWKTDNTPARFEYGNNKYTVSIDTLKKVLVVPDFNEFTELGFQAPWPKNNLHHYEILFYSNSLKKNALKRVHGKTTDTDCDMSN